MQKQEDYDFEASLGKLSELHLKSKMQTKGVGAWLK
jgi:hypothetical protein